MAVLLSVSSTSKEEAADLAAWLRIWGTITGKYMIGNTKSGQLPKALKSGESLIYLSMDDVCPLSVSSSLTDIFARTTPICFKWSNGNCQRPRCRYLHACLECVGGTPILVELGLLYMHTTLCVIILVCTVLTSCSVIFITTLISVTLVHLCTSSIACCPLIVDTGNSVSNMVGGNPLSTTWCVTHYSPLYSPLLPRSLRSGTQPVHWRHGAEW